MLWFGRKGRHDLIKLTLEDQRPKLNTICLAFYYKTTFFCFLLSVRPYQQHWLQNIFSLFGDAYNLYQLYIFTLYSLSVCEHDSIFSIVV